jgi:autotransporter-associated beta strand protein
VDNGSVLRIQGTNNGGSGITVRAEALTISGLGRAGSGGALRSVSGINTWQGKVTLAADARIGAASGSSLTLDVASGNAIEAANFNLTTEGAGRIQINDAISLGSGGLTKIGSGTLVLSAANTYTGPTSVDVGTLGLHNNSSSLQITVASGASLDLNAALNVTTSGTVVFNTGSSVSVSGTPSGSAVTLLTAAGGISGTPSLVPVAGYSLVTTGNSLILQATAGSTYSAWLGTNASTPQLLQNYAFGAVSPTSAVNTSNLPAYGTAGGLFVLSYSVRADDTNLVVEPQGNEDLKVSGGWTTNGISTSVIGTNVVDGVEMQQRQAAVPLTGGKKFLRLRITE